MYRTELGWACTGDDISDLIKKAIYGHIYCTDPDAVLNIETHLFNVVLQSKSCEYNLDVGKQLWLNRSRWSRLIREYVPLDPLNRFLDQGVEILNGSARDGATANMMFRDPDRYAKKHRWGGCLMGATFRGNRGKGGTPCLTFYSRTTYMGYMALLDAAIAAVMANEICKRYNKTLPRDKRHDKRSGKRMTADQIQFRWHISSQQLHCFKTLPYAYSEPDLMKRLEKLESKRYKIDKELQTTLPTMYHMAKWYCKVVDAWEAACPKGNASPQACERMLNAEKYGPFKRIKRRWLEHMGFSNKNLPPSLFVDELDFEKAE